MYAWVIEKPGEPKEMVYVKDYPIPEPQDCEIQVKVLTVALNPVDWKRATWTSDIICIHIFWDWML